MALSGSVIRTALAAVGAVGGQMRSFDELAAGANDALRHAPAGLTVAGSASFLADKAQESAYFRTTSEYGKSLRYDPFRGRGFQMVTWESNYRLFGRWLVARGLLSDPETFVRNPVALSDYRWAWLTGIWYWQANGLWDRANRGDHLWVSQAVNGGRGRAGTSFVPNHWKQRDAMFRAFLRAGIALLPDTSSVSAPKPVPKPVPAGPPLEGDDMFIRTPEPDPGTPKREWPTVRIPFAFEPGSGLLKVDHGGRGGWLHLGRWWVRRRDWSANLPFHDPQDHPVGPNGSERFVGYGWVTGSPAGADKIELVLSAPDGVHIQWWRQR